MVGVTVSRDNTHLYELVWECVYLYVGRRRDGRRKVGRTNDDRGKDVVPQKTVRRSAQKNVTVYARVIYLKITSFPFLIKYNSERQFFLNTLVLAFDLKKVFFEAGSKG